MTDFERENAERQTFGYGQNLEGRRPEQIEREIEQTRERMTRDIDALGERLSPRNLAHEAMDSVGQRARQTGSRLVDFVRENPLPIAAVGLGVTWLMTQRSRSTVSGDRMARYAYTGPERRTDNRGIKSRISHLVGDAGSTVSDAVSGAASTVAQRASDVAQRASDLGSGAKSRLQNLGSSARDTATENPLAVAAGALVVGMLVGLLVPETDRENQMMGAARDRLADRAGDTAHRVVDATVDAADRLKDSVKHELNDRVPQVKEMAQDVARRVVDEAKDAAGRVKSEVKNS